MTLTFAKQQLCGLLVTSNFTKSHGARPNRKSEQPCNNGRRRKGCNLNLCGLRTPPINGRALALVGATFLGALPPVDFLAIFFCHDEETKLKDRYPFVWSSPCSALPASSACSVGIIRRNILAQLPFCRQGNEASQV